MMSFIQKSFLVLMVSAFSLSFTGSSKKLLSFTYPGRPNTTITMTSGNYGRFSEEWKGSDYYYMSLGKDSIICSVLFFLLSEQEQKSLVQSPAGSVSPLSPLTYFSENSNMKKYETNVQSWGEVQDNFMFRQTDITNYEGYHVRQKNMYAYAMADKDLFVHIHLSKLNYSSKDSVTMRALLASLTMQKH